MIKYSLYILICLQAIACNDDQGKVIKPLSKIQNGNFEAIVLEDEVPALSMEAAKPVVIDVPPKKLYTADEIIENYTFIPLETNENSLMGDIEDLCTDDNYIFIFDQSNSKVLQFTDEGKFVRKIGSQGRGPQEYTDIWGIAIDKRVKQICLLDLSGRKLLYFDYNGNCVKEEPLYYLVRHLQFEKGNRYIYTGTFYNKSAPLVDLHRLIVADNEQRPLYRGFSISEKIRDNFKVHLQHPIRKFADGIYYKELLTDTIWKVDVGKYIPAYVLNFPKRGELFSYVERQNMTSELYEQRIRDIEMFTGCYLISDRLAFFSIGGGDEFGRAYHLLYSKRTGRVSCGVVNSPQFSSKVGDYFGTYPNFVYQDTAFISVLQPQTMKSIVNSLEEKRYERLSLRDKQFIESLHDEDNPVLMVIKYKDF